MTATLAALTAQERKYLVRLLKERTPKIQDENACWLWKGMKVNGYGRIQLRHKTEEFPRFVNTYAHRFAWMIRYNTDVPAGLFCCHTCDTRDCVNPRHIFLGTQQQNIADRSLKDRRYKLKLPQRLEVAQKKKAGARISDLSREYKVKYENVYNALKSKEVVAIYGDSL